MDQGTEYASEIQTSVSKIGERCVAVSSVVSPPRHAPWQKHSDRGPWVALIKKASRKHAAMRPQRQKPSWMNLIDFTCAELSRRVGESVGKTRHTVCWKTRILTTLTWLRKTRRTKCVGVKPCVWPLRVDARRLHFAVPSWTGTHTVDNPKPLNPFQRSDPVYIHRWRDGAQGWCGLCTCVLSGERAPGRNAQTWVHTRNCLHKRNRTLADSNSPLHWDLEVGSISGRRLGFAWALRLTPSLNFVRILWLTPSQYFVWTF